MDQRSLLLTRRQALRLFPAAGLMLCAATRSRAETFPSHPLRLISPYAAGGAADVVSRLLADEMGKTLGQPVLVDNLAGASGATGGAAAARSPADGYTLFTGALGSYVLLPLLNEKLTYDPRKDLKPVIKLVRAELMLVARTNLDAQDLPQLAALAKRTSRRLRYGSSGVGSANHLAGELLTSRAVPGLAHVPYRGESPALSDLLGGQLELAVISATLAQPQVRAGKIKVLAALGRERSQFLPQVPTVAEQGYPGCEAETWFGFFVPTATPKSTVDRLYGAAMDAMSKKSIQDQLLARGLVPVLEGNDGASFAAALDTEAQKWAGVIKAAGIRLN